jgi:MFS family permease
MNKILKKTNEITLLFLGCLIGTACLSVFSFVPNIYIKIVFFSIQAIFLSGIFPLSTSIAVHESSKSSGTILGFVIAFAFSGSIVSQPVFGYVAEYLGKHFTAYVALAGSMIGLIFTFILLKVYSRKDLL